LSRERGEAAEEALGVPAATRALDQLGVSGTLGQAGDPVSMPAEPRHTEQPDRQQCRGCRCRHRRGAGGERAAAGRHRDIDGPLFSGGDSHPEEIELIDIEASGRGGDEQGLVKGDDRLRNEIAGDIDQDFDCGLSKTARRVVQPGQAQCGRAGQAVVEFERLLGIALIVDNDGSEALGSGVCATARTTAVGARFAGVGVALGSEITGLHRFWLVGQRQRVTEEARLAAGCRAARGRHLRDIGNEHGGRDRATEQTHIRIELDVECGERGLGLVVKEVGGEQQGGEQHCTPSSGRKRATSEECVHGCFRNLWIDVVG
jgi:hypothetical protein